MADVEEKGYGTVFGGATLADVMEDHDVVPLLDGGMMRVPKDLPEDDKAVAVAQDATVTADTGKYPKAKTPATP